MLEKMLTKARIIGVEAAGMFSFPASEDTQSGNHLSFLFACWLLLLRGKMLNGYF